MAALVADQQRGVFVPPDKVTVRAFLLEEWLPARSSTLRSATTASYEQMIRNYVLPTLGAARVQHVTPAMLNSLYGVS